MPLKLSDNANEKPGRRIQRVISTAITDDWIILDSVRQGWCITIAIVLKSAGSGYVEYTSEDINSIYSDSANPVIWSAGTVDIDTYQTMPSGVTGVRFVNVSGTIKGLIAV